MKMKTIGNRVKAAALPYKIAAGFLLARVVAVFFSAIPFHDGDIEALYYLQALVNHPSTVSVFYPLRYYPLHLIAVLGGGLIAMRLLMVSLFAIATFFAGQIGSMLWGKRGKWAAVYFASNPWAWNYIGRLMPESWLMFGIIGSIWAILKANKKLEWLAIWPLFILCAILAKPIGVLALGSLVFLRGSRQWYIMLILAGVGILGLAVLYPTVQEGYRRVTHAQDAEVPYDFWGTIVIALGVAAPVTAWFIVRVKDWRVWGLLTPWILYTGFDALKNHGYYALPLVALASLFATYYVVKHYDARLTFTILNGTFLVSAMIFTGTVGDYRAKIVEDMPHGIDITLQWQLIKRLDPYRGDRTFHLNGTWPNGNSIYGINETVPENCAVIAARHYFNDAIYGYRCPK